MPLPPARLQFPIRGIANAGLLVALRGFFDGTGRDVGRRVRARQGGGHSPRITRLASTSRRLSPGSAMCNGREFTIFAEAVDGGRFFRGRSVARSEVSTNVLSCLITGCVRNHVRKYATSFDIQTGLSFRSSTPSYRGPHTVCLAPRKCVRCTRQNLPDTRY